MTASATHRAIDAVWRIESARLIAGLARIVRDVGLAEDLAQDALVAALETWPRTGVPDNPGAWLMAIGKRRAVDRVRGGGGRRARHGAGRGGRRRPPAADVHVLPSGAVDAGPDHVDPADARRAED